jgi:hypothetical protein
MGDPSGIVLPPIHPPAHAQGPSRGTSHYALPSIAALEDLRGVDCGDSEAVLRRLREEDEDEGGLRLDSVSNAGIGAGVGLGLGVTKRQRSLSALVYNA